MACGRRQPCTVIQATRIEWGRERGASEEGSAHLEVVDSTPEDATMGRILEVSDVDHPDQHADHSDCLEGCKRGDTGGSGKPAQMSRNCR